MAHPSGKLIDAAFERHQAEDFDTAETLYRSVLGEEPDNLNGLQLLGALMHQRGRTGDAVALLEKAADVLERRGNAAAAHAALYNNLGNALRVAGRRKEATAAFRHGLDLDPALAELHANLGNTLLDDGDLAGAMASYKAALKLAPRHVSALRKLADIQIHLGTPTEALTACRLLATMDPDNPDAHFLLGRALGRADDHRGAIGALRRCLQLDPAHIGALYWLGVTLAKVGMEALAVPFLEQALVLRPDDANAHTEVGNALQKLNETARALEHFRRAAELRPLTTWRAKRRPASFSVLLITSPGVANTPPDFLFGHVGYDRHFLALLPDVEPDCDMLRSSGDLVVNLISDPDQGRHMLTRAADLVDRLGRHTINHPRRVIGTDRETAATLLSGIALCRVPRTIRATRAALAAPDAAAALERRGFAFPLLLRVAGTHGGEALDKIETDGDIAGFLEAHAADALYVTEYADYQSVDGCFRKYRFVVVGGQILPYHLAIGRHWKVHHYTTDMGRHVRLQDEEKAYLESPEQVFSPAHYAAIAAIRDRLGLDFFGIDCSLDSDGKLLLFEVNTSILIHGDNSQFPYKTPFCNRIREALGAMLARVAASRA